MRAFVGSRLSEHDEAELDAACRLLVEAGAGRLRAVPVGTLHLTYAFLAVLPDDRLASAANVVDGVARDVRVHAVTFGAPSVLYGGREARLVLLPATEGAEWLATLSRRVAAALAATLPDVRVSATPAPHVTIARFRRGTLRQQASGVTTAIAERLAAFRLTTVVDAVQVFESELTASGPRYRIRHESRLHPGSDVTSDVRQ